MSKKEGAGRLEIRMSKKLRRQRIDCLFEAADRLQAVPLPPLAETEVEAEIEAARIRPDRA